MDPLSPADRGTKKASPDTRAPTNIYIYERADQFLIFNKGWFNI